ncbi:MAG: type IV secretion protein IcmC [Coxiellaceae bacterium]|nr:type IV secretion protein IcmC [Coxiellaceae bacterium]
MWNFDVNMLIRHLHVVTVIIQDFAIAAGLLLIFMGFMKFKRYGEMRTFMSQQMTMSKPLMLVIGGSLLICTPLLLGTGIRAFWGTVNPLHYMGNTSTALDQVEYAIIVFVRVLGIVVFIRGWIMLAKSGGENVQPGMRGKAIMQLFVGVLMMHFIGTEHLILETLGFSTA